MFSAFSNRFFRFSSLQVEGLVLPAKDEAVLRQIYETAESRSLLYRINYIT